MQHARRRLTTTMGIALSGALLLSACGGEDTGGTDDATTTDGATTEATTTDEGTTTDGGTETAAAGLSPAESCDAIEVGTIGWTEDVAVNALWSHLLEQQGYTWNTTNLEVGGLYSGVAEGELDLFMDAWLPNTHSDYWEQFGDQVNDLVTWYEEAPLTWAVPTYVAEDEGITSIADLQGSADLFGGEIVGIEAGAGLTRISKEEVIPTYELGDSYELVESSTPAMLAELDDAIQNEEPIVVTLWEPHSAYAKWDLTNLEDPENALGDPDAIHAISSQSFPEDCPNAAAALENFSISGEALSQLELDIEEAGEGNAQQGVETWISNNQDLVDEWLNV